MVDLSKPEQSAYLFDKFVCLQQQWMRWCIDNAKNGVDLQHNLHMQFLSLPNLMWKLSGDMGGKDGCFKIHLSSRSTSCICGSISKLMRWHQDILTS